MIPWLLPLALSASAALAENWPLWRGPRMDGVSPDADPPFEWSESSNVAWNVALPGHGSSTPILWGGRLYALSAARADGLASPVPPHARGSADEPPGSKR